MGKVLIFGAGNTGKREYENCIKNNETVIGFIDNDKTKWRSRFCDLEVYEPTTEQLSKLKYDYILIASVYGNDTIKLQLLRLGIDESKIKNIKRDPDIMSVFLGNLKELYRINGVEGSIAEVGVFQGETAKVMNSIFSEKKLYLFDTFEGFHDNDIHIERQNNFSEACSNQYDNTSVELVMNKMENPNNVIIKKGYFPETVEDVDDTFCFVRLDLDLYNPTNKALEFFHKHMAKGGVIIVHDYFGEAYKGIKQAVSQYIERYSQLSIIPIGDRLSIAIVGY